MDYLDELHLDSATRQTVSTEIAAIRMNNARSIRLRIINGHHLNKLKTIMERNGWLNWLTWLIDSAGSGYHSVRTAERDMALATALYDRLADLTDNMLTQNTNLTALRELARDDNAGALSTAVELIQQGVQVKPPQVAQLAKVHSVEPRLSDSVVSGEMTIADAAGIAGRIAEIHPAQAVVDLVVEQKVRSPAVVDALQVMYIEQRPAFDEAAASGALFNIVTESSVPLREASAADGEIAVNTEDAEREARRLAHLQGWRMGRPPAVANVRGRRGDVLAQLAAALPDDDRHYHVYAYGEVEHEPENESERSAEN